MNDTFQIPTNIPKFDKALLMESYDDVLSYDPGKITATKIISNIELMDARSNRDVHKVFERAYLEVAEELRKLEEEYLEVALKFLGVRLFSHCHTEYKQEVLQQEDNTFRVRMTARLVFDKEIG